MTDVRAVGFDLDGTLFDHLGSACAGVDRFVGALGVPPSAEVRDAWFEAEDAQFERWRAGEITFQEQRRERLRSVLPQFGIEAPRGREEADALFGRYLEEYRRAWRPFDDSVDVIVALRAAGLRVGILTNGAQEQQLEKLRSIGTLDSVDIVCTSEEIGVQKPDPRAFRTLAHRLGVAAGECLFVGDNPEHDVEGARRAGMGAVLVDRYGEHRRGIMQVVLDHLAR